MIQINSSFGMIDFILIGINTISMIWIAIGSLKNLLLRFWTVYDMLVLFGGAILMINCHSINTIFNTSYLITVYILIKIGFKYIERWSIV